MKSHSQKIARLTARNKPIKILAKLLLIVGLALLLIGGWPSPVALAKMQFLKEANQWVYQAQHVLPDAEGTLWKVTALKSMEKDGQGFYLQLVTQSPRVHLDATQPLLLEIALGKQFTAPNMTRQYFIGTLPASNFGQYNIQALLPQLKEVRSLQLRLPTQEENPITLFIASDILEEWIAVGTCEYLICNTS